MPRSRKAEQTYEAAGKRPGTPISTRLSDGEIAALDAVKGKASRSAWLLDLIRREVIGRQDRAIVAQRRDHVIRQDALLIDGKIQRHRLSPLPAHRESWATSPREQGRASAI